MPLTHPQTEESAPLLESRDLSVTYVNGRGHIVTAVQNVSFRIHSGEIIGVLGESGSGKSTTAAAIMGILPSRSRTEGSIQFLGKNLLASAEADYRQIRGGQISLISQEPGLALSPFLCVGKQIEEVLRAHGVKKSERGELCREVLCQMQFPDVTRLYRSYPHQLSGGELHRVAIAQALACRPRLVICDEMTRSLDATTKLEIMHLLRTINRESGCAFLFITHDPALLNRFADRVLVMHAGRIVEQGSASDVIYRSQNPYARRFFESTIGSTPLSSYRREQSSSAVAEPIVKEAFAVKTARSVPEADRVLLRISNLSKCHVQRRFLWRKKFEIRALAGVNLAVPTGSLTALVGESGSGKSTLASCLAMLARSDSGEIWLEGKEISHCTKRQLLELRPKVQLVFQDSAGALNPRLTAAEIIAEPLEIQRSMPCAKLRARVCELMETVRLSADWVNRRTLELSGGQRQRLAIARALGLNPRVLILDESLSGLDICTQAELTNLFLDLQEKHGLTLLLISHDLALVGRVADRVAVMHRGRVVEQGTKAEVLASPKHFYTQKLLEAAQLTALHARAAHAGEGGI